MPSSRSFTVDWFANDEAVWRSVVVPHLAHKRHARALEIGTYEGRSALWTLENVLIHRTSRMVCIDDFSLLDPATVMQGRTDVRGACIANLRTYLDAGRVMLVEGRAEDALRRMHGVTFDLIYIDAAKAARDVLEYAVLAWPLLKPRGLLVFDDYTHSREHDFACPRAGIDAFLDMYSSELKMRHSGWQAIVQKRRRPLPTKACRSELFHEDVATV
jgi:predicted O-methyltransferase YrrM